MFCVYTHHRPDGRVFYVGKGRRSRAYLKSGRTLHWKNIVSKYGGFTVSIDSWHEDESAAFAREVALIAELREAGAELCNMTNGGEGCSGRDVGKKLSPEHREKLRLAKLGTKQSAETVAKRIEKCRGRRRSAEARALMSEAARRRGEDYRRKLSSAKTGKTHPAHVAAVRAASARPVICVETGMRFDAVTDAAKWASCRSANISSCLSGRRKSAGGYSWAPVNQQPQQQGI